MRGSRPDRRLVEEQHLRLRERGAGDLEPAALAAAVGADRPVEELGQAEPARRARRCGRRRRVGVDAPQPGVDLEVAASAEGSVDHRVLEHHGARGPGARSGWRSTSCPSSRARARRWATTVVVSMPIVVDFPAPFGPSRPKTSPGATSKSIPFTASTPEGQRLRSPRRRWSPDDVGAGGRSSPPPTLQPAEV